MRGAARHVVERLGRVLRDRVRLLHGASRVDELLALAVHAVDRGQADLLGLLHGAARVGEQVGAALERLLGVPQAARVPLLGVEARVGILQQVTMDRRGGSCVMLIHAHEAKTQPPKEDPVHHARFGIAT